MNSVIYIYTDEHEINEAITSQLNITWFHFLSGFISHHIIKIQSLHYTAQGSRRSANSWASSLIKKLWNIVHQIWLHRNANLHDSDTINTLSGKDSLLESVTTEYTLGYNDLPHVYSSFFHLPLSSLLQKSSKYLKQWFLLIRSAREAHQPFAVNDAFSINGPLRTWIGLTSYLKLPPFQFPFRNI